jgi:hypothetical protein
MTSNNNSTPLETSTIRSKIYTIRGVQVMLDRDLAELYQVETRVLNQAVKRNIQRFPIEFMFQLNAEELHNLMSQNVISSQSHGGMRKLPYVFTEQGVSMLSAVLKSDIAIQVSIEIIKNFVAMKTMIQNNSLMFERFERIEHRLTLHDSNFDKLFEAIESKGLKPSKGIFYDGQVFDAHTFISDLIRSAKSSIILVDNYIDDTTFTLFSKNQEIKVTIYTQTISKQLKLDLEKYNTQYKTIELKKLQNSHDRFLIIDEKEIYHIGASLKDLGKKWFGFSKFESDSFGLEERLKGL